VKREFLRDVVTLRRRTVIPDCLRAKIRPLFRKAAFLVFDLHLRRTDSLLGENLEESLWHKRLLSGTVSL
jgi:hypothetical protein